MRAASAGRSRTERGAQREVRVRGPLDRHRYAHGGCGDQPRNLGAIGGNDHGLTDGELAAELRSEAGAQGRRELRPELVAVAGVDATIHEAEAVRRADERVGANIDGGPRGDRPGAVAEDVAAQNLDVFLSRELASPRFDERRAQVAQDQPEIAGCSLVAGRLAALIGVT